MSDHYSRNGYAIFRGALDRAEAIHLGEMAYELVPPYPGEILRHNGQAAVNEFVPHSHVPTNPILDVHLGMPRGLEAIAGAARSLITSPAVADRLRDLDGAERHTIHQSLLFLASAGTALHIDSWSYDTVPPGGVHSVWIPLEDMTRDTGVPCVIPWTRGKIVTEAALGLSGEGSPGERYGPYHQSLADHLHARSPDVVTAFLQAGDIFVWSSTTPHCTLPSSEWRKRKRVSLQMLVRPSGTPWGNFCDQSGTADATEEQITDRFSFVMPRPPAQ